MTGVEELWQADALPYFAGYQDKPISEYLPSELPFRLGFDASTSLIVQVYNPEVEKWNDLAYKLGGRLAAPPGEGTFGDIAGNDILKALLNALGKDVTGIRILEIGCFNGYLLHKLGEMGAIVIGCEPGSQAAVARERYHLEVVQEMFSPELFKEPFDCVYSHRVLEHIVNPAAFITDIAQILKPGGLAFFGVPDCSKDLEVGNPNMFLHEHLNYFAPESAALLLRSRGYARVGCQTANYGGHIYVWGYGQKRAKHLPSGAGGESQELRSKAQLYVQKLTSNLKKCQKKIKNAAATGKTIGLYGASNAINFLGLLDWPEQPRIFDTDANWHGFYIPGGANPIEPPEALLANPVDQLWVLPLYFCEEIRFYLKQLKIPERIEMLSFYDVIKD